MNVTERFTVLLPLLLAVAIGGLGMRGLGVELQYLNVGDDEFADLTSFESLKEAFNRDEGKVRIVTLLSPSCSYCIKGYRYMRKILDEVDDEDLRMYVVWLPMLSGDSRPLAERMSRKATDARVIYQAWDEARIAGKAYRDEMDMEGVAWDVYYLYGPSATSVGSGPARPAYWEHQLSELPRDRYLSYDTFKAEVVKMLREDT